MRGISRRSPDATREIAMKTHRHAPVIAGVLMAGVLGLVPAINASPAIAAHATTGADSAVINPVPNSDDYRDGYRKGYRDGWKIARNECHTLYSARNGDTEWARGYDNGFRAGYASGFEEYCD
ncbi:hypothetical protein Are01nite_85060 [Actinoplanes regularis]|nr:hypothetical protein Are01nite_85060 [Actinoplanes regularis]